MSLLYLFQVPLMPEQASTFAEEIDIFYLLLWLMTIVLTIGIAAAGVYFMLRYRRRSLGEIPEQIEGAMKLELTWTIIPSIIVVFLYYYGFKDYMNLAVEPPNAYQMVANGKMGRNS